MKYPGTRVIMCCAFCETVRFRRSLGDSREITATSIWVMRWIRTMGEKAKTARRREFNGTLDTAKSERQGEWWSKRKPVMKRLHHPEIHLLLSPRRLIFYLTRMECFLFAFAETHRAAEMYRCSWRMKMTTYQHRLLKFCRFHRTPAMTSILEWMVPLGLLPPVQTVFDLFFRATRLAVYFSFRRIFVHKLTREIYFPSFRTSPRQITRVYFSTPASCTNFTLNTPRARI